MPQLCAQNQQVLETSLDFKMILGPGKSISGDLLWDPYQAIRCHNQKRILEMRLTTVISTDESYFKQKILHEPPAEIQVVKTAAPSEQQEKEKQLQSALIKLASEKESEKLGLEMESRRIAELEERNEQLRIQAQQAAAIALKEQEELL